MTFSYPIAVRWSDIDSYEHVNNVRYFDYLQEARIAFLSTVVGSRQYFDDYPCVLVSQTLDYLRPIVLRPQPYDVDVWIEAVGRTSYTIGSSIVDRSTGGADVYANATSVIVAVDGETHAKRELFEPERAALLRNIRAA
ncbi:acyl-CoA thioesterase [Kribbella sandramycini]|uniref:Acyl-CoA thioester hydrolase n=1 Tax=Kribbella sandramycini TaxID=60450 RepID=A0A7Y4NZ20_9ACTN|nr:acyl-CoA thioesterase [Kribbella sandramycini]MBB6567876.1 acyl-CoA thioester hydrolase [Kribbella sandramycini]NOL39529.1 acyl-CoA thioesterase [Kribbella sandramycini]